MRLFLASGILFFGLLTGACKSREFNTSKVKNDIETNKPGGSVAVNANAFNAFNLWRDGKGDPIMNYPKGYVEDEGKTSPDGVFYVPRSEYYSPDKFVGTTTEGAKVEGDLLIYPIKDGRTLTVKFHPLQEYAVSHAQAAGDCKRKGLRLPHIQELYDFCAAGTQKDKDGHHPDNRCRDKNIRNAIGVNHWSASVNADDFSGGWDFGRTAVGTRYRRIDISGVRCVGAP